MGTLQIDYPVYTLDNRLLIPAGTRLTSEAMDALIATTKGTSYQVLPFLGYGTVCQDILRLLRKPPYHVIFEEVEKTTALSLMDKIRFIAPILESLDYFREHEFYTYRHNLVVFALSAIMARDLLESSEVWITESMAGTLHDLGKLCVPLQILRKSNPLTRTDRGILEHHTVAGFVLLSYLLQDPQSFAARVAKEHHERKDGSGYPLGIALSDRMVEIIAACDVYDALLSQRPYRFAPYDNRTALEEITDMARVGKLSWEVVQSLVSHNRKDKPHFGDCRVSIEKRGIPPADSLYGVIVDEGPVEVSDNAD
jgi:HD-GYP domain-containing protein (c-di-GMP phosphodiesterase class II)